MGRTKTKAKSFFSFLLKQRYSLLFLFASLIFLVHYLVSGQAVYGDGIGYYAHLHSWYFDHNFDSTNEYMHIYTPENNNSLNPIAADHVQIISVSSTGRANNQFSPGSAILLSPFYLVADLSAVVLNIIGIGISRSGYGDIYQILTGIGAISYSVFSLWLTEIFIIKVLKIKDKLISRAVPFFLFFTTFLLFYMSFDVIKSHFASYLFSISFFCILLAKEYREKWWQTPVLAALTGLAGMTRPQDGSLSIIWLLWLIFFKIDWHQDLVNNLKFVVKETIYFASVVLIFLSPMLYQWTTLYHSPMEHQNLQDISLNFGRGIDWFGSLWHVKYGFFRRTPINLLAFLTLIIQLIRKKVSSTAWLVIIFFLINYLIVTLHGGWNVAAFGARMYSSTLVLVVWGLAELFKLFNKHRVKMIIILFVIFSFVNVVSMISFVLYGKGTEAGKSGTEQRTLQRIEMIKARLYKL